MDKGGVNRPEETSGDLQNKQEKRGKISSNGNP